MADSQTKTVIPAAVWAFARELSETSLQGAQSFKTTVLLGDRLVLKLPETSKKAEGADYKEVRILELLLEHLDPRWSRIVPKVISSREIEGLGLVVAQSRLNGEHPKGVTDKLVSDLGEFLRALHSVGSWDRLLEFEGDHGTTFREYLKVASGKFLKKLHESVTREDWILAKRAAEYINATAEELSSEPTLVLIHKDIYLGNTLVDPDGNLVGVIDWAAAQTAPREWEFSILRQRMPDHWRAILAVYGIQLDSILLDVCGVIQSLRFWKSFPHQADFVMEQRNYIMEILDNAK